MTLTVTTASTKSFLEFAYNSEGRNRSVDTEWLEESIDPDGKHVLGMSFLHNDAEVRSLWLVKFKDTMEPQQLWLDVDIRLFNALAESTARLSLEDKNDDIEYH